MLETARVTGRSNDIQYFSADFLSVKTQGNSLHIFAPFLAVDTVKCVVCTSIRNKLTNLL